MNKFLRFSIIFSNGFPKIGTADRFGFNLHGHSDSLAGRLVSMHAHLFDGPP